MIQTCFRLEKDEYLSVIPNAELPVQPSEGEDDYWLEISTAALDELASRIKPYTLHPLMVEDILDPGHSTLLDRYPDTVYVEFPTNLENSGNGIAYLSIILSCRPT